MCKQLTDTTSLLATEALQFPSPSSTPTPGQPPPTYSPQAHVRLKLSFTHTHIHAHTLTLPPTPSRKALEKACSVRCVPPLPNLLRSQLLPPAPATFFQSSSQHRSVKYSAQGGNRMCCCRYQLPVALTTLTFLVKECWERLHLRAAATAAS